MSEALRLVARPPDMSTRVSAEMAIKVMAITSEALTAEQDAALWHEIVTLAVDTSIRRNVKPQGIPDDDASKALAVQERGCDSRVRQAPRHEGAATTAADAAGAAHRLLAAHRKKSRLPTEGLVERFRRPIAR